MTTKKHIHDDDDGTKQESDETPPRTRRRRRGHEQAPWLLESKTKKLGQGRPRSPTKREKEILLEAERKNLIPL